MAEMPTLIRSKQDPVRRVDPASPIPHPRGLIERFGEHPSVPTSQRSPKRELPPDDGDLALMPLPFHSFASSPLSRALPSRNPA